MNTCEIDHQNINEILKGIWGSKCELKTIEDLNDGFAKKTYCLTLRNPSLCCILHIWVTPKHNLTEIETEADWILGPSGLDLFKTNNEFLLKHGICVPEIYALDGTKTVCDYDFAFVKYIDSGNFSEFTQQYGGDVSKALLKKINILLKKMYAIQRPYPGLLAGKRPSELRCEHMVLENALLGLDLASDFNAKIKENHRQSMKITEHLRKSQKITEHLRKSLKILEHLQKSTNISEKL